MNFVRTAIKTALYTAAVLPVAGAWALTPTQVNNLTASNIVYISGSTATDAAIQAWAKLNPSVDSTAPFAAGTYDLYKTASGYVLTGTATSVFGSTISGQNIAIVKQTKGGSATGIHNVATGVAPGGFPDLTNATTFGNSCTLSTTTAASSPFQAFGNYTCVLAESATIVPNAGISDEDPTTWIGTGGVTAADASALTSARAVEVPFAIIASKALRDQLQSLEGLTSGNESFANIPSLSSVQVRAILSGQMTTLGDLYVATPANVLSKVDSSGSFLHVCRRGDTSGSQFAANIRFFGKGCSKGNGVGSVAVPDDTTTQASGETWTGGTDADSNNQLGDLVFAGSGTGDVLKCVSAPVDSVANGDPNGSDTVAYRIGFVSTDQVATTSAGWRYIAVDGIAPTIWNIQLGKYEWIMEDAFNQTTASIALNGGPGNHAGIFNTIQANLSNVNALAGLNAATQNAAALSETSGIADTGIVTSANKVLFGTSNPNGPTSPAWPAAIRSIGVAGSGPNSPISKTYPSAAENNCNGAFQSDPTG